MSSLDGVADIFAVALAHFSHRLAARADNLTAVAGVWARLLAADEELRRPVDGWRTEARGRESTAAVAAVRVTVGSACAPLVAGAASLARVAWRRERPLPLPFTACTSASSAAASHGGLRYS